MSTRLRQSAQDAARLADAGAQVVILIIDSLCQLLVRLRLRLSLLLRARRGGGDLRAQAECEYISGANPICAATKSRN